MSESKYSSRRKAVEEARDVAMRMTSLERAAMMEEMTAFPGFDENGVWLGYDFRMFAANIIFQRFDPAEIKRLVIEIASLHGASATTDVCKMVWICYERGVDVDRLLMTSTPIVKTELAELRRKYRLQTPKFGESKNVITLPRVCLAFPEVTCSFMVKLTRPLVTREKMNSISAEYPTFMMTDAFGSLIPRNEIYTPTLKYAHLLHAFEFTLAMIRKKGIRKRQSNKMIINELEWRLDDSVNRDFLSDSFRVDMLKKRNLVVEINGSTVVSDAVSSAATVWLTRYKQTST